MKEIREKLNAQKEADEIGDADNIIVMPNRSGDDEK